MLGADEGAGSGTEAAGGGTARPPRVLVTYATQFGSTRGIAERIAGCLRRDGVIADVVPAVDVLSLDTYDAVVVGSAVFNQCWLPEAERFVHRHAAGLARRPVWLFSVGTFGDDRRLIGPLMRREPRGIDEWREAVQPEDYRVFAGVIERTQWPLRSRMLYHLFGGRLGDHRNWSAIEAWAGAIGTAVLSRSRERTSRHG